MSAEPQAQRCESCRFDFVEWRTPRGNLCTGCAEGFGFELPHAPERTEKPRAKLRAVSAYHLEGCRGFTQITHEAFEVLASHPHADFRVYVAIVADSNWRTGRCDSSREQLSKRAGVGPASIPRAVKRLIDSGLITVEYKKGFNGHNVYTVLPPTRFPMYHGDTTTPHESS